jgi:putative ATP-binding cassette transporter
MGRSGSGKSTLLRALAGIWPFGEGRIELPEGRKTLFLPQKPYLPLGSLREALLYPQAAQDTSDEVLGEVLTAVGLGELQPSLDAIEPWSMILSLGEQQRIAMARVLLQRPRLVFLDEATSALDESSETTLYELLIAQNPKMTVVSVGHRSSLCHLHSRRWTLEGAQFVETIEI